MAYNRNINGYKDLAKHLEKKIKFGEYTAGSQLPPEIEMSKKYRLNRHTVRSAIRELVEKGYAYRLRGKGTFVAQCKIPYEISPKSRFTTTIDELGLSKSAQVLNYSVFNAGISISEKLEISRDRKVLAMVILRKIQGMPACHTTSYIPLEYFPGMEEKADSIKSLYGFLAKEYGVEGIRRSWSEIEVDISNQADMDILKVSEKMPILVVRSLARDITGNPIEFCISRNRGDVYTLNVNFEEDGNRNA